MTAAATLTHLPLERGNAGFILGDDAGLGFLVIQLASVKLRQPQLDQVGREVVASLRRDMGKSW